MIITEFVLHFITYTVLIIAFFLGLLCYRRNLESKASVAFVASLLLLVSAISLSAITEEKISDMMIQVAMLVVSVTTFLNVLQERKHNLSPVIVKIHAGLALVLLTAVFYTGSKGRIQEVIAAYLIISVVLSMGVIRLTAPREKYAHTEKANRFFSLLFMTVIPLCLIFHFGFREEYQQVRIGFLMPLTFILLAVHKIYDDLQRLALVRKPFAQGEQQLANYGLTRREREIALLLARGISYQAIAEQLFISLPTVKTHCSHIYKKCGVKSRHELTVLVAA